MCASPMAPATNTPSCCTPAPPSTVRRSSRARSNRPGRIARLGPSGGGLQGRAGGGGAFAKPAGGSGAALCRAPSERCPTPDRPLSPTLCVHLSRPAAALPAARPDRRSSKLVSLFSSCFASNYVRWWPEVMGAGRPLRAAPMFDGRAVCYPAAATVRDYLAWRQADCHINNQARRGVGSFV